jgi:hypothetical protein
VIRKTCYDLDLILAFTCEQIEHFLCQKASAANGYFQLEWYGQRLEL